MKIASVSADDLKTEAALRSFGVFAKQIGQATTKATKVDLARRTAIADTITAWLESLDEAKRAEFFRGIEAAASGPNRRKIAGHPLRPAGLDEQTALALSPSSSSEDIG